MDRNQKLGLHRCDLGSIYSNEIMSWETFYEQILKYTENGNQVLDAGAGEGHLKKLFVNKAVTYIGIDSAVGNTDWNYDNIIKADLENLELLSDGQIDLVMLIQVMEHVKNPSKVLAELSRVLKPGKKIFISAPQGQGVHQVPYDFYRFTPYGFKHLLEEAGFVVNSINPQLCGDLESNINKTIWTLQNYIDESTGLLKAMLKILYVLMKLLNKVTKMIDAKFSRFTDPIGYFVVATKVIVSR